MSSRKKSKDIFDIAFDKALFELAFDSVDDLLRKNDELRKLLLRIFTNKLNELELKKQKNGTHKNPK